MVTVIIVTAHYYDYYYIYALKAILGYGHLTICCWIKISRNINYSLLLRLRLNDPDLVNDLYFLLELKIGQQMVSLAPGLKILLWQSRNLARKSRRGRRN
ncbi:hypothetical protein MANES_01G073112v8 [Manihot esculenta]|uniref:Uncharacterized protein n=1 Tax=Manihot esculenta TaxID=3983 RepID=A0ACB7IBF7_MANES|nr:hypothetical protein MANES_01G073112v8 [Manihot esculenta]